MTNHLKTVTFVITLDRDARLGPWSKPTLGKYGLYIFRIDAEIVRVGETASGCDRIVKGFRQGREQRLRNKMRKNYLAYQWREEYPNRAIEVDFFDLGSKFEDNLLRRALEAEVTFQWRIHTGRWPRHMSEIHFLESRRQDDLLVGTASRVLTHYGCKYREDL